MSPASESPPRRYCVARLFAIDRDDIDPSIRDEAIGDGHPYRTEACLERDAEFHQSRR